MHRLPTEDDLLETFPPMNNKYTLIQLPLHKVIVIHVVKMSRKKTEKKNKIYFDIFDENFLRSNKNVEEHCTEDLKIAVN